ncbi:MAG: sugar ABC transporter substrate-binding protein, partial [Oscillospiraceae bacterium]|nr:sugar ABC transporter substrate-binding protein [Oscillospiraceae bacterium]
YYENYVASNFNVTFTYTEQLNDAAEEKSAIERFAAQGYDAIISLSSNDRATQLQTCIDNGLYYAVASGMLDDDVYEQFKGSEYFVGQVGPNMDAEFEAGYAMGQHYAAQGVKNIGIYGAFIPNPMHVYRAAGLLVGLGCTYGGTNDKDAVVGQIFGDQGVDVSKVAGDIQIAGYMQGFGDTTFDELFGILGQGPDAYLSVGMATTFFADSLDGMGIQYSDIDSFTSGNQTHMNDGTLTYLAGKYASSVGPVYALVANAVQGNPIRDAEGNAPSISQNYQVSTDSASFDAIFTGDSGNSPIYSKDVLSSIIGSGVTYDSFVATVESH